MTFQSYNDTPIAGNNPSVDQPNMRTNYSSISALISQDHFGFQNISGGNHKQVHLKNTVAPGGLGASADSVFYANSAAGQSWPFWQNALGSIQMLSGSPTAAQSGQTFLPGGIVLIWDKITAGLNTGNLAITFPLGGFPTNCFSVVLQYAADDNSTIRMGIDSTVAVTKTGFQTQQTATSHLKAIYYLAIGN